MERETKLSDLLYRNEVRQTILEINKDILEVTKGLITYVENSFLISLNEVPSINKTENRLNYAIFLLFAQGVKSAKSSVILITEGYYTNAIMCIRNTVETLFNLKYILNAADKSHARAEKYLTKPKYWANDSIKARAYKSLDRPLYEVYSIFSNYVHSNLMGSGQNLTQDDKISIHPTDEKTTITINFINSILYTLVDYTSQHYKINSKEFEKIQLSVDSSKMVEMFDTERNVLDFLTSQFRNLGCSEEDITAIVNEYKKNALTAAPLFKQKIMEKGTAFRD